MDISGILSQVRSGGFVNPVASGVQSRLNSLSIPSLVDLTTLANAQAVLQSVSPPTENQLTTARDAILAAQAKVNDLIGHTNRISGVDLSGNGTLATIAKTMVSAKNINGESSCSTVLGAFGSLQKAAEMVSDTIDLINKIESFLDDIIGEVNNIPSQAEDYLNKVAQQIASDVGVLAQAKLDVLQAAVASSLVSLFQDECVTQVLGGVMTQPMKNEVTKVTKAIANKKLISIR